MSTWEPCPTLRKSLGISHLLVSQVSGKIIHLCPCHGVLGCPPGDSIFLWISEFWVWEPAQDQTVDQRHAFLPWWLLSTWSSMFYFFWLCRLGNVLTGWPSVLYLLKPCSINHLYSPLRIETFGCPFIKMINPGLPQWLTGKESRLPMQETWVWLLIREDPACHGATKPMGHNFWACALERGSCKCWATRCNYWSARPPEPVLHTKRHHCRAQALRLQRPPPTTATEKPARQRRPSTAKTKLIQSPPSGISYFRISTSLLFSGYPAL